MGKSKRQRKQKDTNSLKFKHPEIASQGGLDLLSDELKSQLERCAPAVPPCSPPRGLQAPRKPRLACLLQRWRRRRRSRPAIQAQKWQQGPAAAGRARGAAAQQEREAQAAAGRQEEGAARDPVAGEPCALPCALRPPPSRALGPRPAACRPAAALPACCRGGCAGPATPGAQADPWRAARRSLTACSRRR
jgi:hypothetical protein